MARALLLKRPSPFAYQGGQPGIDPSHPASNGVQMSAVFKNGNFTDLTTGKAASIIGSPTISIDGVIGPCASTSPGSSDDWMFSGKPTTVDTNVTLALILTNNANTGGQQFHLHSGDGTIIANLYHLSNLGDGWRSGAGGAAVTTITIPGSAGNGHKYFIAFSCAGSAISMVMRDMTTGQIYSGVASGGPNVSPGNGKYEIGNFSNFSVPGVSPIAAAMYANNNALSMPQLLQWAQDPWAFWYPRKLDLSMMLMAATVAAAVKAKMLALLGVG